MNKRILQNLEPQKVFYYFEEICKIPHGSSNEEALSDTIVAMAKKLGYQVQQDNSWNVSVEIPASPGLEGRKTITLQAHLDMVCQKEEGVAFDFKTQPLDIYIDNGFITAKGTTLGADDGFGVAMLLAIMNSPELVHAPLQLLFTTEEEIALVGAQKLDPSMMKGQYLIGLDCAFDDGIVVSCAGVSINRLILPREREHFATNEHAIYDIRISGLTGGHSGNTIHFGRANAIKLLAEVLDFMQQRIPFRLVHLQGGTVINAIPIQASAQIVCSQNDAAALETLCHTLAQQIQRAFARTDSGLQVSCTACKDTADLTAYSEGQTKKAIQLLLLMPNGPRTFMDDAFTSSECSSNVAVLEEQEDELHVRFAIRSNSEYHHEALLNSYKTLATLVEAKYIQQQRLFAWEYQPNSHLQDIAAQLFTQINGKAPIIKKVHSTVEASVFVEKLKQGHKAAEIINIGCNNLGPHTPEERLEIASVGRTYELVTRLIASLD